MTSKEEPWGQLVSTTELESDPVKINKSDFSIGRAPASDMCFNGNKLVSGTHCIFHRDADGKTWLEDRSTNGTLINLKKKINKQRVEIKHGDEVHVVYRKNNPETNIAFVFQDMEMLRMETSDSTLEYDFSETDVATSESAGDPHRPTPADRDHVSPKRARLNEDQTAAGDSLGKKRNAATPLKQPPRKKICIRDTPSLENIEPPPEIGQGEIATGDKDEVKPEKESPTNAPLAKEGVQKADVPPTEQTDRDKSESAPKAVSAEECRDDLEETLMCIICQEIFHNCISLQPCMHSFCAGCYSDWMSKSDECPSCRSKVARINKNHLVNNLVEAYLKAHPTKKRPTDEIKELDEKNKITTDMLYPKDQLRRASDESFSSPSGSGSRSESLSSSSPRSGSGSDSGEDSDFEYMPGGRKAHPEPTSQPFGAPQLMNFGRIAPPPMAYGGYGAVRGFGKYVCRQCPEYTGTLPTGRGDEAQAKAKADKLFKAPEASSSGPAAAATPGPQPGPSTPLVTPTGGQYVSAEGKVMPAVIPPYACKPDQTHALCQCCMQPMPNRTDENTRAPETVPQTSCTLCYRNFCHMYWGCYRNECLGCIGVFKELNFGKLCLKNIVNGNIYESGVLENYLELKKMSVKDMVATCVRRLDGGAYFTQDLRMGGHGSGTVVCYPCGLKTLKELAYQYRRDIPNEELPDGVTSRPDCHWGRNCRTQFNRPHHAARFNHICEQTKTS